MKREKTTQSTLNRIDEWTLEKLQPKKIRLKSIDQYEEDTADFE